MVVHGDDFITVGDDSGMKFVEKLLSESYAIKSSIAGSGKDEVKELKALGRIVSFHDWGIRI